MFMILLATLLGGVVAARQLWQWMSLQPYPTSMKIIRVEKMKALIRNAWRSTFPEKKRQRWVWNALKRVLSEEELRFGVYEQDRTIHLGFSLGKDHPTKFMYFLAEDHLHTTATVLEDFPVEFTTEVFILASHFNNILRIGKVTVDVQDRMVRYSIERSIWPYLFDPGEMKFQIQSHCYRAEDVLWAFDRLLAENEAPAIIIADLLRKYEEKR